MSQNRTILAIVVGLSLVGSIVVIARNQVVSYDFSMKKNIESVIGDDNPKMPEWPEATLGELKGVLESLGEADLSKFSATSIATTTVSDTGVEGGAEESPESVFEYATSSASTDF